MRFVVALFVLLGLLRIAAADKSGFDPAAIYKVPRGKSPTDGPANAPVTIVAWSDYNCGYCNRVQHTLDGLVRLYPGQLRFVHRFLPLDEDNTVAAEAMLAAAAQGKLRPMSDRLYAVWGRVDRPGIEMIARELGLDMIRFRADLDTRVHHAQIAADTADAVALGITGTPTFFINGRAITGNQALKAFVDVVDEELARAKGADHDTLVANGKQKAEPEIEKRKPYELDEKTTYRIGLGLPGHQSGPDDALVTIVAWGDFQCPYCQRLAPHLAHLRKKYGNDVRVVYRHLAMAFHSKASLAAEAAVAAAEQGKFWDFHDQVFANFGALSRADLERFGELANLDMPKLRAALDDRRHRDVVAAESAAAEAIGVDGTPTMFINGRPIVGTRDRDTLERTVDAHLAQARAALATGIPRGEIYALMMTSGIGDDRADPSSIPDPSAAKVTLRANDRSRAVAAACRRRDAAKAQQLANGLAGAARHHAALVCTGVGIDLK